MEQFAFNTPYDVASAINEAAYDVLVSDVQLAEYRTNKLPATTPLQTTATRVPEAHVCQAQPLLLHNASAALEGRLNSEDAEVPQQIPVMPCLLLSTKPAQQLMTARTVRI
jgi:hypothetical protein